MADVKQTSTWLSLLSHRRLVGGLVLRELFDKDPHRFRRFSLEQEGILFDYSKNLITEDTVRLLLDLAREAGLEDWRARLFSGEPVNHTERRAALHMALRAPDQDWKAQGESVSEQVRTILARMERFAEEVRSGAYRGCGGESISDVVHIGIGGSDLGPRLVLEALASFADGPQVHFVSNVDGVELERALAHCDPRRTLFTIVSKSFGTLETLSNAEAARAWFLDSGAGEAEIGRHFIAITANTERAVKFGIDAEQILPMWDWVGGRYSVWSAVGLPIALACGMENFRRLLAGAAAMDAHFRDAPLETNMPVLLAMLGLWHIDFMGIGAHAVVPYTERLATLPHYLQQLEMESNGKSVDRDGNSVSYPTAPVIWGQTGTVGQHAFFQALHQGPQPVPVDFIGVASPTTRFDDHHDKLMANLFAQAEALMRGQSADEARALMARQGLKAGEIERLLPFRVFPGNRPSNVLLLDRLTPERLGALIALYEHKVFCQSVIWRLNAFDQWGVELGKQLADSLLPALREGDGLDQRDSSTRGLVEHYRAWRSQS